MTTIFHTGRKILRQEIGNRNYAEIADLLYFRIKDSKYKDKQGNPFFLLPNIDHISKATGFCKRLCQSALAWLEKNGWIQKTRIRCYDGAVRIKIFLADRFKSVMNFIDSHLNVNLTPVTAKIPLKVNKTADYANYAESDSARFAESYIIEDKKKEDNNNLNSHTKNYKNVANEKPSIVKTVVFDFSNFGLDNFECDSDIKSQWTPKQLEALEIIKDNCTELDIVKFEQAIADKPLQSKAKNFKHLTALAYLEAKKVEENEILLPSVNDVKAQIKSHLNQSESQINKAIEPPKTTMQKVSNLAQKAFSKVSNKPKPQLQSKIKGLTLNEEQELLGQMLEFGVTDIQAVIDASNEIIAEYGKLSVNELVEHVTYLLIELPKKQQSKLTLPSFDEMEQGFNNDFDLEKEVAKIGSIMPNKDDLTMPQLSEKERQCDLVKQADQSLYIGILPDCQRKAFVAIIDYVQRKGVVIGCEKEMYQWLYYMLCREYRSYSNAKDFTHWCNIAISQLMKKKVNRPIGFDKWFAECQHLTNVA
jgi:hypothetical protein